MRFVNVLPLAALLGTASALPWGSSSDDQVEVPSLSVSEWQKIRSMGFNSISAGIKLADDFVQDIFNDVEDTWPMMDDDGEKTIWQLLNEDKDRYSKSLKAIKIEGGHAQKALDDRSKHMTFFAPEDSGIPNPHHGHHDHDHDELLSSYDTAFEFLATNPSLDNVLRVHDLHGHRLNDGGDKDDERKKKIFKIILGEILKYHGLPEALSAGDLASNRTVATVLVPKFGTNDEQPLRIRTEKKLVPPSLELNFYAKVVPSKSDRQAKNGYLHEIDHPLIPPPSVLSSAFFSRHLDTWTTAIQKVSCFHI